MPPFFYKHSYLAWISCFCELSLQVAFPLPAYFPVSFALPHHLESQVLFAALLDSQGQDLTCLWQDSSFPPS